MWGDIQLAQNLSRMRTSGSNYGLTNSSNHIALSRRNHKKVYNTETRKTQVHFWSLDPSLGAIHAVSLLDGQHTGGKFSTSRSAATENQDTITQCPIEHAETLDTQRVEIFAGGSAGEMEM